MTATTNAGARRRRAAAPGAMSAMSAAEFGEAFQLILDNIETVIKGKTDVVRLALVAIMSEGHVLFEDLPGTGKSMLARAIAQSINASVARVQCTPDMLPGDITGSSIFDQRANTFEFRPGPVFANILLTDEINRATPKTQSALLEAMAERRVSADGVTYDLPRPFLVLATQNPIEQAGTFPLPEAQLDRFLFKLTMGYPSVEVEHEIMFDNQRQLSVENLGNVTETETVQRMIDFGATVDIHSDVSHYIVHLVTATREDPAVAIGASPRASIALLRASRVLAAADGKGEVYPDHVRVVLEPVLAHRVVLRAEALLRGETVAGVIQRVVDKVRMPAFAAQ
jgi:MoxR-like ATPase